MSVREDGGNRNQGSREWTRNLGFDLLLVLSSVFFVVFIPSPT
jgi:hypothetical protein